MLVAFTHWGVCIIAACPAHSPFKFIANNSRFLFSPASLQKGRGPAFLIYGEGGGAFGSHGHCADMGYLCSWLCIYVYHDIDQGLYRLLFGEGNATNATIEIFQFCHRYIGMHACAPGFKHSKILMSVLYAYPLLHNPIVRTYGQQSIGPC